jgi:DcmR-like sensory protein/putative zinc finger protein
VTCREIEDLVTAWLDGALPPPERDRFEAHRRECAACRDHVAQVQLAVSALGRLRASDGEDRTSAQGRILDLFRARGADRNIPLGLGNGLAAPGDHIAYFYESEREFDAMAGFLAAGATLGEACVLVGHDAANERLLAGLERSGLGVRALMEEHLLQVAAVRSSADALLLELDRGIRDAVHRGIPMVRILGNLTWGRGTPGWPSDHEVLRLEAQVTNASASLPSIVVCAYDVRKLPVPMLLKGGLECHTLTYRRDCLRHNEHHVPPERFLENLSE